MIPLPVAFSPLVGRASTIEVITALLDPLPDAGGALVLDGPPGIGKSALLDVAAELGAAREMVVLRTAGVQSEARLAFAGLHRLVRPILHLADALPAPQRDALLSAFGMVEADAPAEFLIALAALNLVSEAASDAPLLLLADDAQWLDPASADALAFLARRVDADPIVLLGSLREGAPSALRGEGVPHLQLSPLHPDAAGDLLDETAPDLSPAARAQVLDGARGNPLALVELPAALRRARHTMVGPRLPLTARLEHAFSSRARELPPDTQALLLAAALNDGEALAESLEAATLLVGRRVSAEDLAPALAALLVSVEGLELRFRHPLIRSALSQAAALTELHAAHGALAEVLAGEPDRSVWHQAAALVAQDEDVASALEVAAGRAERRRATATAIAGLERAAQLTADPARRGGRLLRAAAMAFAAGRRADAIRLLDHAEPLALRPPALGRLRWLRELVEDRIGEAGHVDANVALADEVHRVGDTELALNILRVVATACWISVPDGEAGKRVVAAAERLPVVEDEPRLLAILASAAPLDRGGDVIRRLHGRTPSARLDDPEGVRQIGIALTVIGHFDQAEHFVGAAVPLLRAHGQLGLLADSLTLRALGSLHRGVATLALPAAEEAARLARETGQPRLEACALLTAAHLAGRRGDVAAAQAAFDRSLELLGPQPPRALAAWAAVSRGGAALGDARAEIAFEHLRRVFDPSDPASHPVARAWALADFAEAALLTGHRRELSEVADEMEAVAVRVPSSLLQTALSYVRPLVAETRAAEHLFQLALARDLAQWPFFRARVLAAYGSWLRRQRRTADSRPLLRAARDAFDALGAPSWADRAQQELRAAGEGVQSRAAYARDRLTAQELQVAQMAAEGLSNKEIGQRLYLSHRTVGSHLYRLFPKLGITSRSELAAALDQQRA